MKRFLGRAIILIFIVAILASAVLRGIFDKLREGIMTGFDRAVNIVGSTVVNIDDLLDGFVIDGDGSLTVFGKRISIKKAEPEEDPQSDALGGKRTPGSLSDAIDVSQPGFQQNRYTFSPAICRALDVNVENCDIAVLSGDYSEIGVEVYESDDFTYSFATSDNTLVIRDGADEDNSGSFFGFTFGTRKKPSYTGLVMVISLPEEFAGEINIATTNGDMKLGNLELDERLSLSTTNGKISLSDIDAYDIKAVSTEGRLELERLSATEIDVSTTNDRVKLDQLTAKRLNVTTDGASIDFSRLFGEKFSFKTSGGDISGSILGSEQLFSISTLTDRTATPKSVENARAQYKLTAETSGGDITIKFVE